MWNPQNQVCYHLSHNTPVLTLDVNQVFIRRQGQLIIDYMYIFVTQRKILLR